jgi:hypothetical protein
MTDTAGLSGFSPILVLFPIGAALAVLGFFGWRWERRERARRARIASARLPDGVIWVRTESAGGPLADTSGRVLLILSGTFAANVGRALLIMLHRCGLSGVIGSILLLEMDRRRRERFLTTVPPIYRDRIVAAACPALPGGLGNRSPKEALAMINRWGPAVIKAAHEVCLVHQHLHNGDEAALGLVFASQGGQAILGTQAVEVIRQEFGRAQFYGFSALPVDDRLLGRAEDVLDAYREAGVQGFVVSSNLLDEVRNDWGLVAAIVGLAAAAEVADADVEPNNALSLLFPEEPGGLVSYSVCVKQVAVHPFQTDLSVRMRYYVEKDSLLSTVQTALEEVEKPAYHALGPQEGRAPSTSRFDLVLIPVDKEALKEDEDDIVLSQQLTGHDKRNYHLLFASTVATIDREHMLCPVAVVSLAALVDPQATLQRLMEPAPLAPAKPSTRVSAATNGRNGKETAQDAQKRIAD